MYRTAYLVGALIFGIVWTVIFVWRKDLRREMLVMSFLAGIMGPLSEHFYLKDYWQPKYWFPAYLRIEDFLAGFFLGGIGAVGYELVWRKKHKCACGLKTNWALPVLAFLGLSLMVFLFHGLGWNSIYASIVSFVILALFLLIFRPEMVKASVGSGLVLALVMLVFYLIYQKIYPGIITEWWNLNNISGVLIAGVPIEELLWGFSWGMVAGPLYEFSAKVKLVPERR